MEKVRPMRLNGLPMRSMAGVEMLCVGFMLWVENVRYLCKWAWRW